MLPCFGELVFVKLIFFFPLIPSPLPLDDFPQSASLKHYELEDPDKIEYKCEKSGNVNVLHWGWVSIVFG
jgi:hypothetical protein